MFPFIVGLLIKGSENKIRIAANIATTPPSLFGIDRKMAYAHKKYHSGLICAGVTKGLAGRKLSGSPREVGQNNATARRVIVMKTNPTMSFTV